MDNGIENIFVFDVDGTLMKQSENKIEQESVEAIREISKYGNVVLASARPLKGIKNLISGENLPVKYFISLNGALIISEALSNITYPILPAIVEFFFDSSNLFENLWFYTESDWYSTSNNSKGYLIEKNAVSFDALPLGNYQQTEDVLKITIVSSLTINSIRDSISKFSSELEISSSNKQYIEINSITTNKYLAAKKIFSNSKVRIFSFGDSNNDIELLKSSFFSSVVCNATEQAKQVANYVSKFSFGKGALDAVEFVKDNFLK